MLTDTDPSLYALIQVQMRAAVMFLNYRGTILQGGLGIHSREAWWQAAGQDQGTAESAASCHSLDTGRSLSRRSQRALLCAEVASCLDFLQLPLCIHPEMLGA